MQAIVAIDVPLVGDARLKNWAKIVEFVDVSKSDGWAYEGDFVAVGGIVDLAAPCVLVVYGEKGARGNPQQEARAYSVNTDGTLSLHATASGRAWARTLRDTVAELLDRDAPIEAASKPWDPLLMGYATEALSHELDRRSRR